MMMMKVTEAIVTKDKTGTFHPHTDNDSRGQFLLHFKSGDIV